MAVNNWIMYEPIHVLSITILHDIDIQWINHLPSQFTRRPYFVHVLGSH